jgi:uncharacterized protein YcfL
MRKIVILVAGSILLSGCAAHHAKDAYIKATVALNACILANPGVPTACAAQATVQQNDLLLYTNLTE